MKTPYTLAIIAVIITVVCIKLFAQPLDDATKYAKYFSLSAIGYAENFEPIDTIYSLVGVDFTSPNIPGKFWKKMEVCCGAPNGDVITVTVFYSAKNSGIDPTIKRPYVIRCVAGDRCTAGTYKVNCPPDDSCDIIDRYMDEFVPMYDSTGKRLTRKLKMPEIRIENGSDMD